MIQEPTQSNESNESKDATTCTLVTIFRQNDNEVSSVSNSDLPKKKKTISCKKTVHHMIDMINIGEGLSV